MKYLFPKGNKINVGRKQSKEERLKRSNVAKERSFGKWMIGKKHSQETINKMKESRKGRLFSEETRKKISISNTGKVPSEESKRKNSKWHKGKKHTEKTKQLLREISLEKAKRGKSHPAWRGGISRIRYPTEFNNELKLKIRQRDNFTCCLCRITEEEHKKKNGRVLSVNHIDFNKNNCKENNLNTLCARCNTLINRDREKWIKFFKKI